MRLSRNHVDYMAFLVFKALQNHPNVTVEDPDAIVGIARHRILEDLAAEQEIEEEAKAKLEPHKAQILREGADYAKMLQEGKRQIAKKRGFVL